MPALEVLYTPMLKHQIVETCGCRGTGFPDHQRVASFQSFEVEQLEKLESARSPPLYAICALNDGRSLCVCGAHAPARPLCRGAFGISDRMAPCHKEKSRNKRKRKQRRRSN